MSLFEGTAEFYRQFRSGVPAEVAAILLDATSSHRPRRLLDIGTGTGFVVAALATAVDDVIAIDLDDDLLAIARGCIPPRPGQRLSFVRTRAEEFSAPAGWKADLVTICRTFHWLDRPAVLRRLDQVVAADGVVAVFGDNSIWADNAGWKSEIKTILAEFLGERRRAGAGTYQRPPRPYTEELEESAFSHWTQIKVPVRRERSLDSVVGYLHSTSFAAPALFGDRLDAFDQALRDRLPVFAEDGIFIDHNEFDIVLARRPSPAVRPESVS